MKNYSCKFPGEKKSQNDFDCECWSWYFLLWIVNNHKTQWNKKSVKCARIKGSDLKHQAIQIESVRKNFTIVIIYQRFNFQWKIFFNLLKRVKVENWSNKCICTKKSFLSQLGMIYSLARNYAASRRIPATYPKESECEKAVSMFFQNEKSWRKLGFNQRQIKYFLSIKRFINEWQRTKIKEAFMLYLLSPHWKNVFHIVAKNLWLRVHMWTANCTYCKHIF